MAAERLARFFGLTLPSPAEPVERTPGRLRPLRPVADSGAPRPVEPALPSLEEELARLDGRAV